MPTGDNNTVNVARRIDERAQNIMDFVEPLKMLLNSNAADKNWLLFYEWN